MIRDFRFWFVIVSVSAVLIWAYYLGTIQPQPVLHSLLCLISKTQNPTNIVYNTSPIKTNYISYQGNQNLKQKHIMTPLIDRYGLSATQAADLDFRIHGSAKGFDFGSNTGSGLITQFDESSQVISTSMNPVAIAYQNYIATNVYPEQNLIQTGNPITTTFISILTLLNMASKI